MAEYDIQGKITFDTSQAQTALKQTASAADQAAGATAKVGDAAKTAQPQIGQFGSALGLAGQAVGQLVPGLGQVVTSAGAATGVIQSLTTAGLGPLGLAIGAVSVAVMGGVALWKAYSDEQKEAKKRTDELKKSLDEQIESLDTIISRNAQIGNERDRAARIAAGQGTSAELEANVIRMEQIVRRNTELLGSARGATAQATQSTFRLGLEAIGLGPAPQIDYAEVGRLESNLAASTNRLAQARAQLAQGIREGFVNAPAASGTTPTGDTPRTGGGRGGGRRREGAQYDYEASGDARRDIERENRWIEKEEQETNARQLEDLNNFLSESADAANYYREEERKAEEEQQKELTRIQDEAEEARLTASRERKELILETSMESLDTVLSAFDEAATANLEAMLTGGKMTAKATQAMVKETMLALTTESIVQGLKQTALGLGALAMGSPSAALHFASAAKFAAVGVAAGIAGAGAGGFEGVGAAKDTGPAAATGGPALSSGATGAMSSTVVINWGSSGLVYAADRAQLGRDISGMISEAHGRLGRGA